MYYTKMHSETLRSDLKDVLSTMLRIYLRSDRTQGGSVSECKEVLRPGFVTCFESPD
jgi:hypothetical protein